MHLLIIGGTRFVGRAIAEAAQQRGHSLTLFHRGQTNPDFMPRAEHILGDRDGGLSALDSRTWDAVIDTCGYVPRIVEQSVRALAGRVGHYTFISTLSVYADPSQVGIAEDGAQGTIDDESMEEINGDTYGPLKVLCENVVTELWGDSGLLARPGLIVGPHDPTDRFSYWPDRMARGGDVLAPGSPDAPVQFIDARDLAEWVVTATEQALSGPYNLTGPATRLTMADVLETCEDATLADATLIWVSEPFLKEHEVAPYTEMPLWIPAEFAGYGTFNIDKALAAGLTHRPLSETVHDTLAWLATRPADHEWRAGLTPEREKALLAAWRETQ